MYPMATCSRLRRHWCSSRYVNNRFLIKRDRANGPKYQDGYLLGSFVKKQ